MAITGEHAQDVLARLQSWMDAGSDVALIVIMETQGGAVRAPGALLAVTETDSIGYISGGCIDEDVKLQARQAIVDRKPRALRYGQGSPFVDLPLPCGGAIEVLVLPRPNPGVISQALERLMRREALLLAVSCSLGVSIFEADRPVASDEFIFHYAPKLRVRIAGRGADALALASIVDGAGYDTHLQLLDTDDIEAAQAAGLRSVQPLSTPSELTSTYDDAWTAFVLLFHDQDWEVPLLQQALAGPAFYIGAVGSQRTHERRVRALIEAETNAADIDRIHGPIGLVSSLRDASMLAVSTLAEIIECFPGKARAAPVKTACILLAAGASSRFSDGDKLLADLDGLPVLERAGASINADEGVLRLAVIAPIDDARRHWLRKSGWRVVENPDTREGQSTSLRAGLKALETEQDVEQVVILLGDMPNVPANHVQSLIRCADIPDISAIMSQSEGVLTPPALFKRHHFKALGALEGDRGAKALFLGLQTGTLSVDLSPDLAVDVDTVEDLNRLRETVNA